MTNTFFDSKSDLQTVNLSSVRFTSSTENILKNNFYSRCCCCIYCKRVEIINDTPAISYYICCFKTKDVFYLPQ